jgi:hypothetical protein
MIYRDIEALIEETGLAFQSILYAAFLLEELETIGGRSCLGGSCGGVADPANKLDRAYSVTRHIKTDHERRRLRGWVDTLEVEPRMWPNIVRAFWFRVPYPAVKDMANITPSIVLDYS